MKKTLNILVLITLLLGITVPSADASYFGFENVVEDTDPDLGGNLDVNGNSIVSTSSDIAVVVDTTGDFYVNSYDIHVDGATHNVGIGTPGVTGQKLTVEGTVGILEGGGSPADYTILQGGDQASNITFTFPDDDGSNDNILAISAASNLPGKSIVFEWITDLAGIDGLSEDPAPTLGDDLNVYGNAADPGSPASQIITSPDGAEVAFLPNGTGDFVVDSTNNDLYVDTSAGNVGIGKTNPTTKLEVNGNVTATVGFTGGDLAGNVIGTAATATQLSGSHTDCSSGEAAEGIDASGAADSCLDVWTVTENNAAGYFTSSSPSITTPVISTSLTTPLISGGADTGGDTQTGTDITFQATSNAAGTGGINFRAGDADGVNDMVILSSGFVGVGVTDPGGTLVTKGIDSGSSKFSFRVTDDPGYNKFSVKNNGVIGVGIQHPSGNFHVYKSGSITDDVQRVARFTHIGGTPADGIGVGIEFEQTTDIDPSVINKVIATIDAIATDVTSGTEDGDLVFNAMGSGSLGGEEMRITSDGKIGIGTTAPTIPLHVVDITEPLRVAYDSDTYFKSAVGLTGVVTFDAEDSGSSEAFVFGDHVTLPGNLEIFATSGFEDPPVLSISSAGKLGLGTATPGELFDLNSNFQVDEAGIATSGEWNGDLIASRYGGMGTITYVAGDMFYANSASTFYKRAKASTVRQVMISGSSSPAWNNILNINTSNNKIGIGTTNPQSDFHVADGSWVQLGAIDAAPSADACTLDTQIGRIAIDTTAQRFYVCNGATRGWDYLAF